MSVATRDEKLIYQLLWAKTSKDHSQTHSLVCHLIDVAQVTLALWDRVLTHSIRAQIADALALDVEAAGRLVAFWAGLHDLGKASPCFQRKHEPAEAMLTALGLPFPRRFARESCYHGTISAHTLPSLLEYETDLPRRLARQIARSVGGHHGVWPLPGDIQALGSREVGDDSWAAVRRDLLHAVSELLSPPRVSQVGATREEENSVVTLLSGLTSVADWIGSMEDHFPYTNGLLEPTRYSERAARQAQQALLELGWIGWRPPREESSFHQLFCFNPRPMQEAVVELSEGLDSPALVIIEAPTGVGKTEAALYLADHWAHGGEQRGLYIAMPTMATSNQMFRRVQAVLARRYPNDLVNLHLIHGQAQWSGDMQKLRLDTASENQEAALAAMAWFLPRKRSLLAPFGVGTVDQALLSVLQARHFFVRLFGLSHKTVIFDEVHAYDTYMSAIFQRLLDWLRSVGASVVILSATLPTQTRHELLWAYTGRADVLPPDVSYPAISWATAEQVGAVFLESPSSRTLGLEWIGREPEAIARRLDDELRDGGCAAVICNTVGRAQEIYKAIRDARIVPQGDLVLFHARFPFAWRQETEERVLQLFGPTAGSEGKRPHKAIVVATQVIEQSLDLDFDLMVSDLAPVDLMIQRAGRLHRHERDGRPQSLAKPRLLIVTPTGKNQVPDFDRDVYIYERYVLLRSYLVLQGRTTVTLPTETATLIEAVYDDEEQSPDAVPAPIAEALVKAREQMRRHQEEHAYQARQRLVPDPRADDLLDQRSRALEEDSPELHEAFQALTRLTRPGISLVCMHQTAQGLSLEPDGSTPAVDLSQTPGPEMTRQMAQHSVTVQHRAIVRHFLEQPVPAGWREHPLLHNHRAAVFTDGICPLPGTSYVLRLNRELGMEIVKEGV